MRKAIIVLGIAVVVLLIGAASAQSQISNLRPTVIVDDDTGNLLIEFSEPSNTYNTIISGGNTTAEISLAVNNSGVPYTSITGHPAGGGADTDWTAGAGFIYNATHNISIGTIATPQFDSRMMIFTPATAVGRHTALTLMNPQGNTAWVDFIMNTHNAWTTDTSAIISVGHPTSSGRGVWQLWVKHNQSDYYDGMTNWIQVDGALGMTIDPGTTAGDLTINTDTTINGILSMGDIPLELINATVNDDEDIALGLRASGNNLDAVCVGFGGTAGAGVAIGEMARICYHYDTSSNSRFTFTLDNDNAGARTTLMEMDDDNLIEINATMYPETNDTWDLGTATKAWNSVYAQTYNDLTPAWEASKEGSALDAIIGITSKDGEIDHDSYPEFAINEVNITRDDGTSYIVKTRDIGATLSMTLEAIKELEAQINTLQIRIGALEAIVK